MVLIRKKAIADEMLKHGFILSFGKSVLHNLSLQTTLKEIPLEKNIFRNR